MNNTPHYMAAMSTPLADPDVEVHVSAPDPDTGERAAKRASGLREAADHVLAHPDLPAPYITSGSWGVDITYQLMLSASGSQREAMAAVVRAIGGRWEKVALGDTFLMRQVTDHLKIEVTADREQVCTRRVVGTETVTVPAVDAKPERIEERDVVEWDCDPVLAEHLLLAERVTL